MEYCALCHCHRPIAEGWVSNRIGRGFIASTWRTISAHAYQADIFDGAACLFGYCCKQCQERSVQNNFQRKVRKGKTLVSKTVAKDDGSCCSCRRRSWPRTVHVLLYISSACSSVPNTKSHRTIRITLDLHEIVARVINRQLHVLCHGCWLIPALLLPSEWKLYYAWPASA